jgi:hypothetical protein
VTDVRDADISTAEELFGSKQADLQAAREQIAGPVPLIEQAPDCHLSLPRGLFYKGMYKKDVVVRELTGMDEEALAKHREPSDYYDMVVALGVERIDDLDLGTLPLAERQGWLRSLLIGERDQIYIAIIRATFGERKVVNFRCVHCDQEQEMELLLSEDFKPKVVEDVDNEVFTFSTSKGHELQYRLVTGDDQREAYARKGATTAEQNTILLSRCITKLNGGLIPDPTSYVRNLGIKDRQTLLTALVNHQPSIDLRLSTTCVACGQEVPLALGWADLFRT